MSKRDLEARPVDEKDLGVWDELARRHGSVFDTVRWTELFRPALRRIGLYDAGGALRGGFCVYEQRKFGLRILRNPPCTPQIGPFHEPKASNPAARSDEQRAVGAAMAEFLAAAGAPLVSLGLAPACRDCLPFLWRRYKVVPRYTYLVDLTAGADQIRKNMSASRRNDVSKATRDGLVVRPAADMREVSELVRSTFGRQGEFIAGDHLDSILFRFADPTNSYAYVVTFEDRVLAACAVVHDERTAYYLLGGYRAEDRHHGAGGLAVAAAIQGAQERGLKTFDFEGSSIPPIERFFRGFGGQLTPYFSIHKAWLPVELALHLHPRFRSRF